MDYKASLGINEKTGANEVGGKALFEYVNMRLSAAGEPVFGNENEYPVLEMAMPLLENYRDFVKRYSFMYCPADQRIMNFMQEYLDDVLEDRETLPSLPHKTFVLDRFGTARMLSLPPDKDTQSNNLVHSYRVRQGILNNPKSDRRTTAGVFHVAEGEEPVLGLRKMAKITHDWTCIDNFRLYYVGQERGDNIKDSFADKSGQLSEIVDVYDVAGQLVRRQVKRADAVKGLKKGIYVVNGEKFVVAGN